MQEDVEKSLIFFVLKEWVISIYGFIAFIIVIDLKEEKKIYFPFL